MPAVTRQSIVDQATGPLAAEVSGEVVLMSLERGHYYGLDDIGSHIWSQIAQPVRVADLVARLAADYDGDPAVIESDVLDLLNRLLDHGLLELRTPPPAG